MGPPASSVIAWGSVPAAYVASPPLGVDRYREAFRHWNDGYNDGYNDG